MTLEEYKKNMQNEEWTPGWDAIDKSFEVLYPSQKPRHYATNIVSRASLGGDQYLDGYSVYVSKNDYCHIVTYGMSALYANEEVFGGEWSGWGYEMTFKLATNNPQECLWTFDVLANLAFFTNMKESFLEPYHFIAGDNKALNRDPNSIITGLIVVNDTEISSIDTLHGRLDFLQLVGITQAELEYIANFQDEETSKNAIKELVERMKRDNPYLITNMDRKNSYV